MSRDFGINSLSVLDQILHFDVCRCLPQDIMRVIFEGVLNIQTKLLLQHVMQETDINVDSINRFLDTFDFGDAETDRPAPLERARVIGAGVTSNMYPPYKTYPPVTII